jgi:hypothetical protein
MLTPNADATSDSEAILVVTSRRPGLISGPVAERLTREGGRGRIETCTGKIGSSRWRTETV